MEMELTLPHGVRVALLSSDDGFRGVGGVTVDGFPLRSPRRPMFVEVVSPDGYVFVEPRPLSCEKLAEDEGREWRFALTARPERRTEWMLHTVRPYLNLADDPEDGDGEPEAMLSLRVAAAARGWRGFRGVGFSYRYRVASPRRPVYKLLDHASWEPGGRAAGNALWFRQNIMPAVFAFADDPAQHYSTEWYLPGIHNPNIFQFHPLQTHFQGFTFTVHPEGVLATWATEPWHVRTLLEKPRRAAEIRHWHEHAADLDHEVVSAPMEVLWFAGVRTPEAVANLYAAVTDAVSDQLHAAAGLRRERVEPYGLIEEWGLPDFERYREKGLPKLIAAGAKWVGFDNQFQNDMNVYGVSNMCCTIDLKIADAVGEDKVRAFCRDAARAGARVEMWGNTSISTFGIKCQMDNAGGCRENIRILPRAGSIHEVIAKAKDPFVRNPTGAMEADHYAPVFAVLNLRDPDIRAYWLRQWRYAREAIGISGIFLDSSFNLSSDKFHFRYDSGLKGVGATLDQTHLLDGQRPDARPVSAIQSQYLAHLSLVGEMQRIGYRYSGEDLGVFGISRNGPSVVKRLAGLPLWGDSLCDFDRPALEEAGYDPADVFFRGLAYRMMWFLFWDIANDNLTYLCNKTRGDFDIPRPEELALFRAFNRVEPHLHNQRTLPDDAGVEYRHGGVRVLWAFRENAFPVADGERVHDCLADTPAPLSGGRLLARPRRVYRLTAASASERRPAWTDATPALV